MREKSRVLLVDGEPDEGDGEVFFVRTTLDVEGSGVEAQVVTESGFDETNLDAFDLIWWCNVQAPSEIAAKRLEEFVTSGGGLVITCGSLIDAPRYNELLWRDGDGLLPLPIGEIAGDSDRPEHGHLADADHAIVGGFSEFYNLILGNWAQFKRWLVLEEPADHEAAIVARVTGPEGAPILATRTYSGNGKGGGNGGEVALFATTADGFWCNLPGTDLFLVMVHELHKSSARREDPSKDNLDTDSVLSLEMDPGVNRADVSIKAMSGDDQRTFTASDQKPEENGDQKKGDQKKDDKPGENKAGDGKPEQNAGDKQAPQNPGSQDPNEQRLWLDIPMSELTERGAYELERQRHDGLPDKRMIARNGPIAESHLGAFDEQAFKRFYPSNVHDLVTFVRDETGATAVAAEGEAWPLLAALLLAGLLAESLLAWRFGRR